MPIYQLKDKKLTPIRETGFDKEKQIQVLTEQNLETLLGYQFVDTEVTLQNFRIDTLAFDRENKAFIVIEYKRDKSFSVIDQGYSYLALLLNNKADFVLKYNEQFNVNLRKDEVDWSQSKVLFMANSFTTYQLNAINFRDLPIELWEVKQYDNETILYNQLQSSESSESIKTISKNKTITSVSKEVKVFTVEDHVAKLAPEKHELYEMLHERIISLGNVNEVPKKLYVAYKANKNFADLIFYKNEIRITLNLKSGELNDPKAITTDFTKPQKGHWGNGDYEVIVRNISEIPYAMILIEQAYNKAKN